MKQKLLLTLLVFFNIVLNGHAQKTISGKISNEANEPVPNAAIAEKGT